MTVTADADAPDGCGDEGAAPTASVDVEGLVVVVPAHDEAELLGECLASVARALRHPAVHHLRSTVVVSLDACGDESARVARRHLRRQDLVVDGHYRNVGAARAAGSSSGLEALGLDPPSVWLAHTDADTVVPHDWLASHLQVAGPAHGVAGIVHVDDWSRHHPATRVRFEHHYRSAPDEAHPHVHGANLGVRASAYLDAGGFPPLALSEDHALWDALRARGHRLVSSRRVWVTTSGRRRARARGGFADTLLALECGEPAIQRGGSPRTAGWIR